MQNGEVVNIGLGIPVVVANYIAPEKKIIFQTENGALMFGPTPEFGKEDSDFANAASQPITLLPDSSIFDIAISMAIPRYCAHVRSRSLEKTSLTPSSQIRPFFV
ncbi:butyrate-acetoacetate CoA-transferase subunit B [Fusibacter sp. 3D3]|nr:butyrate-acetoacetate CoA-transferase subunit B [Fusibacter sp. 3D3]